MHEPTASRSCQRDWAWVLMLALVIVVSRIPAMLQPIELDVDESLMLAEALRYRDDVVPWRSAAGTTSGPVTPWVLALVSGVGVPLHYSAAHALAALFLAWTVGAGVWAARYVFGSTPAIVGGIAATAWIAVNVERKYIHFATALVPIALLATALALAWWPGRSRAWAIVRAGLAGAMLGLVPWAKMQVVPIAFVLGVGLLLSAWARRRESGSTGGWGRIFALVGGALLPSVVILGLVAVGGVFEDFRQSYVVGNLHYAGDKSFRTIAKDALRWALQGTIAPWFLAAVAVWGWAAVQSRRHARAWLAACGAPAALAWVALAAAWFACSRPLTQFAHYQFLLLVPLQLVTAGAVQALAAGDPLGAAALRLRHAVGVAGLAALVLFATNLDALHRAWITGLRAQDALPTSAGRAIAAVRAVVPEWQRIGIWGWFPSIHVELGQPQATRHGIPHFLHQPGPNREFLRASYLRDLQATAPDVFLDMCGARDREWAEDPAMFPALAEWVHSRYELRWAGETPFYGATATVRVFVRRNH